jgi:DNA invertase Pin-like site-specific DNA recombinase
MGVFAQLERGMVVARLRRGRQLKREQHGYAQGRPPPYGYRAEGGSLGKSPEEQIVIEEARRLRKGRRSLREIAAQLEAKGYRTRIGGSWHPAQVPRLFLERKTHVVRRDA